MNRSANWVVPYVFFALMIVANDLANQVASAFLFGGSGLVAGSVVALVVRIIAIALGIVGVVLLARGNAPRLIVGVILVIGMQAVNLLLLLMPQVQIGSWRVLVLLITSTLLASVSFMMATSAWVVVASRPAWMFAVALVATIANVVLGRFASSVVSGLTTVGGAPASVTVVIASVTTLVVGVLVFTGFVLIGQYMKAGAPGDGMGGSSSGFSSDRMGW